MCKQPIRRAGLRGDCGKQQKTGKRKKSKTQKEVLIRRVRRKRHPVRFSENSGLLVSEREVTQTGDRGLSHHHHSKRSNKVIHILYDLIYFPQIQSALLSWEIAPK